MKIAKTKLFFIFLFELHFWWQTSSKMYGFQNYLMAKCMVAKCMGAKCPIWQNGVGSRMFFLRWQNVWVAKCPGGKMYDGKKWQNVWVLTCCGGKKSEW